MRLHVLSDSDCCTIFIDVVGYAVGHEVVGTGRLAGRTIASSIANDIVLTNDGFSLVFIALLFLGGENLIS